MNQADRIEKLPIADRVALAKEKMKRVVDHFLYVLELHENNAIIVYSAALSGQIPASYAANAFRVFQSGLHHLEIIRLNALWDTLDLDKECITTVVKLIDHPDVIAVLAEEARSHWVGLQPAMLASLGDEQAQRIKLDLAAAIQAANDILLSEKLKSLRNLRDKHLAHSLAVTRAEKSGPIAPVKYGNERDILDETCHIVEKLYCGINGVSLSVADSRAIHCKNAHALWDGCRFDVLR